MPLGDSPHHGPPRRPGAPSAPRRPLGRPQRRAPAILDASDVPRSEARPRPGHGPLRFTLFVRYILPAMVVLSGVVAMTFGSDTSLEGGAGLVSAGLAIWFVNWLFRLGAAGDAERDEEDRAREYFDRHGRWPEGR